MDIQATLAANMRKYRKQAGLTQEKLAELCGLHRTYIGGIEQERINVSLNNMSKIAHALGVSVATLVQEPSFHEGGHVATRRKSENVCTIEGDEVRFRLSEMSDPDLGVQILVSLILNGVTDEDELAREYKKTERKLLKYFNSI